MDCLSLSSHFWVMLQMCFLCSKAIELVALRAKFCSNLTHFGPNLTQTSGVVEIDSSSLNVRDLGLNESLFWFQGKGVFKKKKQKDFRGRGTSFPLKCFLFYFINSKIKKKGKTTSFLSEFNGSLNWILTEVWINKNWKLENWNDKIES